MKENKNCIDWNTYLMTELGHPVVVLRVHNDFGRGLQIDAVAVTKEGYVSLFLDKDGNQLGDSVKKGFNVVNATEGDFVPLCRHDFTETTLLGIFGRYGDIHPVDIVEVTQEGVRYINDYEEEDFVDYLTLFNSRWFQVKQPGSDWTCCGKLRGDP